MVFLLVFCGVITGNDNNGKGKGRLLLTVGYCPTLFSGAGAIVEVDSNLGSWEILGTFKWPGEMFVGCPALLSPTVTVDQERETVALQVLSDQNYLVEVSLRDLKVSHAVQTSDYFFNGFNNMVYQNATSLLGFSGTVTQTGYCFDGINPNLFQLLLCFFFLKGRSEYLNAHNI